MLNYLNTTFYKIGERTQEITDIITAVTLKRLNIDKTFLYLDEYIHAGETPEAISYRLYGDVRFWGIILLVNNIVDPFTGLPMTHDLLVEYTKAKYGDPYALHWFYDEKMNRICDDRSSLRWRAMYEKGEPLPHYIVPVSHIDYETKVNEDKMLITIINPSYIHTFEEIVMETLGTDND